MLATVRVADIDVTVTDQIVRNV